MTIRLYYHPWSRSAATVWLLEEVGVPYELEFVDIMAGGSRTPEHLARNRMGKLPVIEELTSDGASTGVFVSEAAAIGVYLADRYAPGRLAPALDDPKRGEFLRWCFFSPSVLEPAVMAKMNKWEYNVGAAGFGTFDNMLATLEEGIQDGFLLGDDFTMADAIVGSTVRFLVGFKVLEATPAIAGYLERINARPGLQKADALAEQLAAEHGLNASA